MARIEIDLDAAGAAPSGAIMPGDGSVHRFSGWIELAGAIEDWRREGRDRPVEHRLEPSTPPGARSRRD